MTTSEYYPAKAPFSLTRLTNGLFDFPKYVFIIPLSLARENENVPIPCIFPAHHVIIVKKSCF